MRQRLIWGTELGAAPSTRKGNRVNESRFDVFVQTVAAGSSRRQLLRGVVAGALATLVGSPGARTAAQGDCPPGQIFCEGVCTFPDNYDPYNCGACGRVCPSLQCVSGFCIPSEPPECGQGLTLCEYRLFPNCVDLLTDSLNCGACNNQCIGSSCIDGVCQSACGSGLADCGGQCVDLATDTYHCGACFSGCTGVPGPGQSSVGTCAGGVCRIVCLEGYTDCFGACVDVLVEPSNCGGCGNVCVDGVECIAGVCGGLACQQGLTDCSGACIDLGSDPANCGGCGLVCNSGTCIAGTCEDAPSAVFVDDVDALNHLLSLEHMAHAFYRDGLRAFDDLLEEKPRDLRVKLAHIRDQDRAHAKLLKEAISNLGGESVEEQSYEFGYNDDFEAFRDVAERLAGAEIAAYLDVLSALDASELRALVASIATVEGRHAAYLGLRKGSSPFPEEVDAPKNRPEVMKAVARFAAP